MLGIFLDTETNGLNYKRHKTIEIAFKIMDVTTGQLIDSYESIVALSKQEWQSSDPVSLHINGFKWETVAKGNSPDIVALEIEAIFKKHHIKRGEAVFICQNPSFDRVFFSQLIDADVQELYQWPYHWLDLASMFWSLMMVQSKNEDVPYPWTVGFTKDKIAHYFNLGSEEMPHRAMNGVNHLIKCYETVVGFPQQSQSFNTNL